MNLATLGPVGWLLLLAIAGTCGAIAQGIAGYSHGGSRFPVLWSIIGASLFVGVISMFRRRG
jgi:hypothetical protein